MSDATLNFKVTNDPMFAENGYTVYLREGGPCWVIDPGLPPQAEDIVKFIRDHDLKPEAVIITHAHGDHIAGVDDVRSAFDTPPLYLAEPEWHMLGNPNENLSVNIGIELTVSDEKLHDLAPGLTLELDGTQ